MKKGKNFYRENRIQLWVMLAAAVFVSLPLCTDFLNAGQDTAASVSRIRTVAEGLFRVFPIRVGPLPKTDFGYEASCFSADVFYLIPAMLFRAGVHLQASYKLTVALFQILTAIVSYFSFYGMTEDSDAAMAAGFLYVLCPARIFSIYGAGNLSEMFGWTFLPIVIWGLYRLLIEQKYEYTAGILITGYSLVLLSWPVYFFGAAVLFIILFLIAIRGNLTRQMFRVLAKVGAGVCGINAWYLIPMVFRLRDVAAVADLLTQPVREYALYLNQYVKIFEFGGDRTNVWERGLTSAACVGPGIIVTAVVFFYLSAVLVEGKRDSKINKVLLAAGIFVLLSSNLVPWDLVENKNLLFSILLGLLQTPAKLAVIADTLLIAAVGLILSWIGKHKKLISRITHTFGTTDEKICRVVNGSVCLVGFLTAQFQVGRLLTTRGFIREEQVLEYSRIGYRLIEQESSFWRLSEAISFVTVVGMILVWRFVGRGKRQPFTNRTCDMPGYKK